MDSATMTKMALGGAVLFAIYKFVPNQAVKAMALGAAGVMVAKQLPYVKDAINA